MLYYQNVVFQNTTFTTSGSPFTTFTTFGDSPQSAETTFTTLKNIQNDPPIYIHLYSPEAKDTHMIAANTGMPTKKHQKNLLQVHGTTSCVVVGC
jgi:hypothetical protein